MGGRTELSNKLLEVNVERVRVKNPREPQTQGEFAPTHKFFTDFHWEFMKKIGDRVGDGRKPSLRVQTQRKAVDTEKAQNPNRTLLPYRTKPISY